MAVPTTAGPGSRQVVAAALTLVAAAQAVRAVDPVPMYPTDAPHSLTGLCFHDGDLFAVGKANVLIRYDPATGEQLELVSPLVPGLSEPHIHSIAAGEDTFWVVDTMTRTLFALRFSDYEVVATQALEWPPGHPFFGLTFHDGFVWAGHHSGGPTTPVEAIDPQTGQVAAELEFGAADVHGLAWVGGYLWSLDSLGNEIRLVGPTGQVHGTFGLPFDTWAGFAHDGERFWVLDLDTFYVVDLPVPPAGDLDGDGAVCVTDLLVLLNAWGDCPAPPQQCPGDLDGDGAVGVTDFLQLLNAWGPC